MRYLKEAILKNKYLVVFYIVAGMAGSFLINVKADCFQQVIDGLADRALTVDVLFWYGGIVVVHYALSYLDEYPGKKLEQGIFLDFKLFALEKISRIQYSQYQKLGMGKLTQQIENGAQAGKSILCDFWFCAIRELVPTMVFSVYFIWKISCSIACIILCGYVGVFLVTGVLLKVLYQMKEKLLSHEEDLNHFLVRGIMEMVVFRVERQFSGEIKKARSAKEKIVKTKVKMNMIHEAFFTIFAIMEAALELGVLVYTWKSCSLTAGEAVALITLIGNAYTPVAIFNVLYVQYKLDKAAFARLEIFLMADEDRQLIEGHKIGKEPCDIEIRDLSFGYGARAVLEHLSLTVKGGQKTAFVGESGSGKSTLVKLLAGLLKYETGSIRVDGKELSSVCLSGYYEQLSYASQECPVFDGTVRENIVFDREAPRKKLEKILESVQLGMLLQNLPKGLESGIGERGISLSGGERQRLALARILFSGKQIIILDEATSALDNLTEAAVMDEVYRELDGRTVIVAAHRLESIKEFDKIVVFRQGKIVGQGTFAKLMEENEYFRELYHLKN